MADPLMIVPSVLASLSAVGAAYAAYNKNDKGLTERLAVVETKQEGNAERLGRIETNVNRIETKVDRLLERD